MWLVMMLVFATAVVAMRFTVTTLLWSIMLGAMIVIYIFVAFIKGYGSEENQHGIWFLESLVFAMGFALTLTLMWESGFEQIVSTNETASVIFGGL